MRSGSKSAAKANGIAEDMNPDPETPSQGTVTATTPLRILIVDDQDSVRMTVRMILESQLPGSVIIEAAGGRDAVALANVENPAVIFMDLMMPAVSGLQATREILAVQPKSKIVMFSGYRSRELVNQARESGAVGYLFKPFKPHDLMNAIRDVTNGQLVFPSGELDPGN